jgi:hypothetical protein
LYRRARELGIQVNRQQVQEFLTDQQAYSLHKPVRKNFKRNKTIVNGIDYLWQADLADMQDLSRDNQGHRYILTVIDVFSKFAWAIPVKDKGSKSMLDAFKTLFHVSGRVPKKLQTDQGKEFLNKEVQKILKSKNVEFYFTNSENKASVVERFNRTLKTRIWTYFSAHQTRKYLDILPNIVDSYNHTIHRTIGMKPADVKPEHEDKLWVHMYGDGSSAKLCKRQLKTGDMVRISKHKRTFDKGYLPNWTQEHFIVKKSRKHPRQVVELNDISDEPILGTFYSEEIQPIKTNANLIEKVLRKRKVNGREEMLVKWLGWPTKFNSWITSEDVQNIEEHQKERSQLGI